MSWGPLLVNLGVTAATVAVLMLATFWYAMRTRVHAIMDTVWGLGFVVIALVSFGLSAGYGVSGRRVLVLLLTAVGGCGVSGLLARTPGGCWTAGCGGTPGIRTTSATRWCGSGCGCWPARTGSGC
jgi:hypothetical protein